MSLIDDIQAGIRAIEAQQPEPHGTARNPHWLRAADLDAWQRGVEVRCTACGEVVPHRPHMTA